MAIPDGRAVAGRGRAVRKLDTIYKNFNRWAEQGVWGRVLEEVQALAHQCGELDWVASIDSTIVRVHQHGVTLKRHTGGQVELQEVRCRAV